MKKYLTIMLVLTLILSLCLTGCECQHEWSAADCVTAKTCAKCGETEGEALGHTWVEASCKAPKTCSVCAVTEGDVTDHVWADATCDTPKTCTVCQQTEGEALGHTWVDANFQTAKTCSVCDTTEGEPLTPAFAAHELAINVEEGKEYDYVTCCYTDTSIKTVGKLIISDYRIFESDETHEAKEGYEWRALKMTIKFSDDNAYKYAMTTTINYIDYYNIDLWDTSEKTVAKGIFQNTINFNDKEYDCITMCTGLKFSDWKDHECICTTEFYAQVPIGYDGIVFAIRDAGTPWGDGQHIYDIADENTLFFRLYNK